MQKYSIIQDDSSLNRKLTVTDFATLDANWSCNIEVNTSITGGTPIIDRAAVKAANLSYYNINVTPAESAILTEGIEYYWIVRLANPTLEPAYHRTFISKLEVKFKG